MNWIGEGSLNSLPKAAADWGGPYTDENYSCTAGIMVMATVQLMASYL